MDKNTSIETYRKKRKRRQVFRRVLVFLLVITLAGGGLIIYRYADQLGLGSGEEQTSFPVSLSGYTPKSIQMCGDNLALLTDKNFSLYSKKGKTIITANHGYSNPGIKCSSKRVLIYDISGTNFSVESKTGNIISKEMDNKILFGEIADNGNTAIVTEDARYQCRVTVFNENGQEIYRWYSAEKLVTGLDFTDSGAGCVVSAFNTVEGSIQSEIFQLDLKKDKETRTISLENDLAVGVNEKSNGNFHIITDANVQAYSSNGTLLATYEFSKELLRYSEENNGYTVVMLGDSSKSEKTVAVLDTNGGEVGKASIENSVRDLYTDGNNVYILTIDQIISYSMSMEQGNAVEGQKLTNMIAGKDGAAYAVKSSQIERYSIID